MKNILSILIIFILGISTIQAQSKADQILDKVDQNMSAKNQVSVSEMVIHGQRRDRTISSKTYAVGSEKSFTEYLSPAREKGTKMLKLDDRLWIYSPTTDRTIQISGHMLRQSVMGSDLSYEDMMEDHKLTEIYSAKLLGEGTIGGRKGHHISLTAKVVNVAYPSQKLWVDAERFVPLKQELYAKSGKLLKRVTLSDVKKVDGRWYPMTIVYKDVLKSGDGTELKLQEVKFNQTIPAYIFTKAALKQ